MDDQKAKGDLFRAVTIFVLAVAVVIVYSAFWGPLRKISDSFMPARTVTVSAEGKVVVSPDIANLSFSVVSEGEMDVQKIADENNTKMNDAIAFIKTQGIDAKDIKTTQYSLNPRYNYDKYTGESSIYGYTMTQTVYVKIRDFKKIPGILSGLPEVGINQIQGISFDIEDQDSALAGARASAFAKAAVKAREMASENHVMLKRIISFYESGTPLYFGNLAMESYGKGGGAPVAAPTIEPGSQEVTVTVSVTYELW